MKKIASLVLAALACVLFFSCSLDGKFKDTSWEATTDYGITNEETKEYEHYTAKFQLDLNSDYTCTFKITPQRPTEKYVSVNIDGVYVIKEVLNESKGYNEDWLIVSDGTNIIEFKIEECLNPQPTHYELKLEDSTWGYISLLKK